MKTITAFFLALLLLAGCSPMAAIEKLERIPQDVVEHLQPTEIMTVYEQDDRTLYLILMSSRDEAEATLETAGEVMLVRVDESGVERAGREPMVFRITRSPEFDTLDVYLNGEPAILTSRPIGE